MGVRDPLVIAVVQPECADYDVATNAARHAAAVRAADARVVVFPELSLTGYHLDAPTIAPDDPRLGPLVEACAETGAIALAGAPVAGEDGRSCIGVLAFGGDGAKLAYRKICLGGTETDRFSPGSEPAVVAVDGWRLGLAVCRDMGVPEHAARTAALDIDAYVAGTLEAAPDRPIQEDRARRVATEYGVWVAVASFAGSTGGGYASAAGHSGIWSADGILVAQAGPEAGLIARATLT